MSESRPPGLGARAGVRRVSDAARPVLDFARQWSDPRRRAERRIRRTRIRAAALGTASGSTAVGTVTVAAASAPEWLVVGGSGMTLLLGVPAALAYASYRRLRSAPLPPAAPGRRELPPACSAAREPMTRLAGFETSLHELLAVLARAGTVPAHDLDDTARIAASASESLTSVARDIVAMERAAAASPGAARHLESSVRATAQQLTEGVEQFDSLVAAAALLTAPSTGAGDHGSQPRQDALQFASDRLEGWAFGLERLRRP